jgi:hypothetical protein
VSRIKALYATLLANAGYKYSTLYCNLRRLYYYIENNARTLVNDGIRYHKGLPISGSIEPGGQSPHGEEATNAMDG